MIMAIAGAAVLTQIQGIVSDQSGSIKFAYWVPAVAFIIIAYYAAIVSRNISLASSVGKDGNTVEIT
jgi:FHS family L-fucose permease-like MFS transporter